MNIFNFLIKLHHLINLITAHKLLVKEYETNKLWATFPTSHCFNYAV